MSSSPIALAIFDIDGVVRDVGQSYRRAIADTVEFFTQGEYRPTPVDIDGLKSEGIWNNDWRASQELIRRFSDETSASPDDDAPDYDAIVDYFQGRYRGQGQDPTQWDGYITKEPLLMSAAYLSALSESGMPYGFFSGATRGSAEYILKLRLGLQAPVLVAMEDAPSKPDPRGLYQTIQLLEQSAPAQLPVLYVGDTVADMATIQAARQDFPERHWLGIGVLPPHVQGDAAYQARYEEQLHQAGAAMVVTQVEQLTRQAILPLLS